MTDRDRSGLAFSSDGDSSHQNGRHPVQSDQVIESNGSDTGEARFVEARYDPEFREKVRNPEARTLSKKAEMHCSRISGCGLTNCTGERLPGRFESGRISPERLVPGRILSTLFLPNHFLLPSVA